MVLSRYGEGQGRGGRGLERAGGSAHVGALALSPQRWCGQSTCRLAWPRASCSEGRACQSWSVQTQRNRRPPRRWCRWWRCPPPTGCAWLRGRGREAPQVPMEPTRTGMRLEHRTGVAGSRQQHLHRWLLPQPTRTFKFNTSTANGNHARPAGSLVMPSVMTRCPAAAGGSRGLPWSVRQKQGDPAVGQGMLCSRCMVRRRTVHMHGAFEASEFTEMCAAPRRTPSQHPSSRHPRPHGTHPPRSCGQCRRNLPCSRWRSPAGF